MATLTQTPDPLSLSRNIKDVIISTSAEVRFRLKKGSTVLVDENYQPDSSGQITIDIRDVVTSSLSIAIPNSNSYEQTGAVGTFEIYLDSSSSAAASFTAVLGGVSGGATASTFLPANFLTWQAQEKDVTADQPEWLTYYFTGAYSINAKFYNKDGTDKTVTLMTGAAGKVYSVNCQFSRLWALGATIVNGTEKERYGFIDVWVDNSGTRLTYVQRYCFRRSEALDEVYLCQNSVGGIDTFLFTGEKKLIPELEHTVGSFDNALKATNTDTKRRYSQNTGLLKTGNSGNLWDFFRSLHAYYLKDGTVTPIVLDSSTIEYSGIETANSWYFEYRISDDDGLLKVQRSVNFPAVIEIPGPDQGVFYLAPRVIDYPAATIDSSLLLLLQSPYSQSWMRASLADLLTFFNPVRRLTQLADILLTNPADGQVLKFSNGYWINGTDSGGDSLFEIDSQDVKPKESRNIKTPSSLTIGSFKIEEESIEVSGVTTRRLKISRTDSSAIGADVYTTGGLSAYGQGTSGGGGANLYQLEDVLHSGTNILRADGTARQNGDALVYNSSQGKWVAGAGGSGEPSEYIKSASVSGNTLTLTKKDDTTVVFTPAGSGTVQGAVLNGTTINPDASGLLQLGTLITSHQTVTLESGSTNGTLKLTTAAGTVDNIAVSGLGSLAYKSSLAVSDIPSLPASKITGLEDMMDAFDEMFELEGSGTSASPYVIKAKHDLYSTGGISAYGQGSGGGGGGSAVWGGITGTLSNQTDLANALAAKQDELTAGTGITITNNVISATGISITIDSALSSTSTNPVQNCVITNALAEKAASSHTHTVSQITDFPTNISAFTNDAGYLTSHQSLSGYATQYWVENKGYITSSGSCAYATSAGNASTLDGHAASYFATASHTHSGYLSTSGGTITGNLTVSGTTTLNDELTVNDDVYISGNLGIGVSSPSRRLEVNGNAKFGTGATGDYIQIGSLKLVYDSSNSALRVEHSTSGAVANFYATGGVSAYGQGTTSNPYVTWSSLASSGSGKIHPDHLRLFAGTVTLTDAGTAALTNDVAGSAGVSASSSIITITHNIGSTEYAVSVNAVIGAAGTRMMANVIEKNSDTVTVELRNYYTAGLLSAGTFDFQIIY